MKTLSIFIYLSLSLFSNATINPTKIQTDKYCFVYCLYKGKVESSFYNLDEKILFISEVKYFDCEYVSDCDKIKDKLKADFKNTVSNRHNVNVTDITREYFSSESKAEEKKELRIKDWKSYGYKIIKI